MRRRMLAAFACCLSLLSQSAVAETVCGNIIGKPLPITSLGGGLAAVPATIGNRPVKLVIDTGAAFSLLDDRLATELRLARSGRSNASLFGGFQVTDFVTVPDLKIGDQGATAETFGIFSQLSNDGVQGTLGAPALAHSSFDLDLPGNALRLVAPAACGTGQWTFSAAGSVSLRSGPQILFMATLDGEDLLTILDSGAEHSSMDLHTAKSQFGLGARDMTSPGTQNINGVGIQVYSHPFKSLDVENFRLPLPAVQIADTPHNKRGPQLILGADFLRRVRIFVDWQHETLYFAPSSRP